MHSSSLLRALTLVGMLATFLLPAVSAEASAPLRTHAAARGKFIGAALATGPLSNETSYRDIAATEFNQVTAENAMKWDSTEPSQGQFNFSGADAIVNFATQNTQQVHGHTLVWHNQTPSWVQSLSATAMRTAMQNHISQVVGRYAGNATVVSWDVVNEVFDDNGGMRSSFWYNTLGQSFIADAAVTVGGQTVTAKNANYNGTLAAGGSTGFGFQVSRPNGNTQTPSGYTCA